MIGWIVNIIVSKHYFIGPYVLVDDGGRNTAPLWVARQPSHSSHHKMIKQLSFLFPCHHSQ